MVDVEPRARPRRSHYRDAFGALTVAAVAYLAALVLSLLVAPQLGVLGLPGWVTQLLAFLLIWVPLVAGVLWAGRRHGTGSLRTDAGLSIRAIDLGIGLLLGLVLRFTVEGIAPTPRSVGLDGQAALPGVPELVVIVLGAALVAPLVEELFFRGLLQRSVSGLVAAGRAVRVIVSVVVSTPLFVLLHLVGADPTSWGTVAIVTGASGLVFGLLAAIQRRLGSAIVAHVVFNVVGLAILYVR